ncbi:uncharacterized protein LOC142506256 [Primulina tabacum]|uniref:uncharacterized protein LOC142506256 n=1 Tax=Primulina tabacum TaxID=48773 RepID=UPI003F5A3726
MAAATEIQLSLKVMMVKESNKVLYAEIDSNFADVLLSFLTLPLGTIVRLLIKHYGNDAPILGSLNSLYAGLLNLDSSHFSSEAGKLMLLYPRNSLETKCRKLKLQIDDTPPVQYFVCGNWTCASMYYSVKCLCPNSANTMTRTDLEIEAQSDDESVFTEKTSSFLLLDNLQIRTNTLASFFQILKSNGIKDTNALEERTLIVGLKEENLCYIELLVFLPPLCFITFVFFIYICSHQIMELLKGSLVSKTPITDMVHLISSATTTSNEGKEFSAYDLPKSKRRKHISSDSKRITVKVLVQKSTNRFLLAQARKDFIDLLFSLLAIPLGSVQSLLGRNTCFGSINNLFWSMRDLELLKHIKIIFGLIKPKIPPHYLSLHQVFSLDKKSSPMIYKQQDSNRVKSFGSASPGSGYTQMKMIDPKGEDGFVKGPTTFMVSDDMVVSPTSSTFIITTLNHLKIPIHDVEEKEVEVGLEEALSILKASLTSICELSEGLKPFLK